jgi:hypothetical protein
VKILTLYILLISAVQVYASEPQCDIIRGDKKHNRIKLAFFAEGYTDAERATYEKDVETMVCTLFTVSPFKEYKELFTVFRVWTPSKVSGLSISGTDSTYFGGYFSGNPYISEQGDVKLRTMMRDTALFGMTGGSRGMIIGLDLPVVVFNYNKISGRTEGGMVINCSPFTAHALLHELGHLLGHLEDEYDTEKAITVYESKNATQKTDRDSIRWRQWINKDTPIPTPETEEYSQVIGLFEGAAYHKTGWYRPKLQCKMNRNVDDPFCEVCREAIACAIIQRRGFDSLYPAPESVVSEGMVSVTLASDSTPFYNCWYFNGVKIDNNSSFLDLKSLKEDGTIEFIVKDTMGFIRDSSLFSLLRIYAPDTTRWYFRSKTASITTNKFNVNRESVRRLSNGVFIIPNSQYDNSMFFTLDGKKVLLHRSLHMNGNRTGIDIGKNNASAIYVLKSGGINMVLKR